MIVESVRLDKWLATAGIGTRSEVKKLCKAGRVRVNGEVVKDPAVHAVVGRDVVECDGEPIPYEQFVYFMMYKPQGVLSATEDVRQPVVTELLAARDRSYGVFPVGRLDKDAEGLLLLTNDGQLAHSLLSPKRHVPKRYFVRVEGCLDERDRDAIAAGVMLEDGYACLPGRLEIHVAGDESEASIEIYEGKFHQVKRMFQALGKQVTFLKRVTMGPLVLDPGLTPGAYRPLSTAELEPLLKLRA
ncbi:pseudouridine synthase [Alicyclobacillus hesperidum]|uniref:pseudouridine synthase n=1 Tax=Alicyclobacillus hesperidum TaxID=89784 RepID=UPI0007194427|nr:pseudouridine synthase [Alicyclobacillus hesperidum]KRW91361.1 pseudouridine synthase [Alicyclobacillus tengchongensis]